MWDLVSSFLCFLKHQMGVLFFFNPEGPLDFHSLHIDLACPSSDPPLQWGVNEIKPELCFSGPFQLTARRVWPLLCSEESSGPLIFNSFWMQWSALVCPQPLLALFSLLQWRYSLSRRTLWSGWGESRQVCSTYCVILCKPAHNKVCGLSSPIHYFWKETLLLRCVLTARSAKCRLVASTFKAWQLTANQSI